MLRWNFFPKVYKKERTHTLYVLSLHSHHHRRHGHVFRLFCPDDKDHQAQECTGRVANNLSHFRFGNCRLAAVWHLHKRSAHYSFEHRRLAGRAVGDGSILVLQEKVKERGLERICKSRKAVIVGFKMHLWNEVADFIGKNSIFPLFFDSPVFPFVS